MSKYDRERGEAAKKFANLVGSDGPTRQDVVMQVLSGSKHTRHDRDAQLEWLQQDAREDRLAEEVRNDWVVILCVAMFLVFGWFLLNGVADYVSGMPV